MIPRRLENDGSTKLSILSYLKSWLSADIDPFLHPVFTDVFKSQPLIIYDVGAAGEVYCPIEGGPNEQVLVYGFEPVKKSYDALVTKYTGNPFVECRQLALSDRDGVVTINQLEEGLETSSSIYSRDGLDLKSMEVEVESARLDSVPDRFDFPRPDFIKLDTEGSEAQILEAGKKLVDREVLGIVTEISFWRRDTGGAVFSEIDQMLTQAGFVLFDLQFNRSHLSSIGGKKDKLRTGDALYLRDFAQLCGQMGDVGNEHKRAKLFKLACLCVSWRYLNYALELIEYGRKQGLVSEKEFSLLSSAFASTTDLAERIPDFPGRATLSRFTDILSYGLHRQAKKGIPNEFNGLGNTWVVSRKGAQPTSIKIYKPVICDETSKHIKVINLNEVAT